MLRQAVTLLLCRAGIVVCAIAAVSAQTVTFAPVGSIAGPADLVRVQGRYAYIAAGKTLTLVDISNPAAPTRTGSYTFPEKIWGFRVVGSAVYVADDFFGLGILDVSNAAAPTLRGFMKTPGQAKNVAVFGTKAVVADHMSGVDFIDVSNPAKPVSLGSFFLDGYARDVVAAGSLAYAVDAPAGLYVFDLSKPGPLDAVSTQQSAAAPGSIVVSDVVSASPGTKVAVLVGAGSRWAPGLFKCTTCRIQRRRPSRRPRIERRGDGRCVWRSRARRLTWRMGWRVCRSWISRPRRCRASSARTRPPTRRAMWPSPTRSFSSLQDHYRRATCLRVLEKC